MKPKIGEVWLISNRKGEQALIRIAGIDYDHYDTDFQDAEKFNIHEEIMIFYRHNLRFDDTQYPLFKLPFHKAIFLRLIEK